MRNVKAKTNIISTLILLSMTCAANAGFDLQLYTGDSSTLNHNTTVNLPDAGITGTHKNLKFNTAIIVGGRATYWIDNFNYAGFGLNISHFFGPDQKNQVAETDLCVIGIDCRDSAEKINKFNNYVDTFAFQFLLRYPLLKSTQFTNGRLQPYFAIGPSLFVTTMKDTDNFIPAGQTSTDTSWGLLVGAGVKLYLTEHVGAFFEYQDSNFQVKDNFYNARIVNGITLGKTLGKATFNIQSILGGIVFSF